jgi:hypothetical protein
MTYTASKITALKSSCPICNGDRIDCRSTDELIHCYSHLEPPQGYEFKGLSRIGASLYAPARDTSKPFDREAYRASREVRLAKQAKQQQQVIDSLPSLEARDRTIKGYPQEITTAQNADLLRRGLTQAEIDLALSKYWFFGLGGGYGIAAYDPVSRLLVGAQRANDDRTKKYTWGVFAGKNHIKETGENPLFVWVSPNFDESQPYEIKYCEGALKSLIRAFQEWRSNPQIIVIGAAGGIFGNQALERVLSAFPDATSHTLLPDADSQNAKKLNIDKAYGNLAKAVDGIEFADWEQWQDKAAGDCDETFDKDSFNGYSLRSPNDFAKFFEDLRKEKEKARAFSCWEKNKAFTPDIRLNASAVFSGIPIPEKNSIVGIKSDFGTQKTRGMLPHLSHWQELGYGVILGGYRNALLMQTINVWSEVLRDFALLKAKPSLIYQAASNLAACLDQFTRKKCEAADFDNRILVLDEADAVELHLLKSGTLKDNRSEVYALFCEAVRRAEVIYLMSAGLSDATVRFIAEIRGNADTKIIKYQNDFVNAQKFIILNDHVEKGQVIASNRSIIRTKIENHASGIASRKAFCVVSDSQNELKSLEIEVKKLGVTTFRYDSETSDTEEGRQFAGDPNEFILQNGIKALFVSPSGNSGLSCTIYDYFEAVYGIYFGILDVDSFLQMPVRIRDQAVNRFIAVPKDVALFGEGIPRFQPEAIEKDISTFINEFGRASLEGLPSQDCLTKFFEAISDRALNDSQFKRFAQIQASNDFEKAYLRECLETRLKDLGHTFTTLDGSANKDFIEELIETKEEVKRTESKLIFDSEDITIEKAKVLQSIDCSYPDRLKVAKAIIKENLPEIDKSEVWSPEFIKLTRFDDRKLLKQLDTRFLTTNPDIAKSKAVDRMAYLLELSDTISAQDIKSPLPYIEALRDSGALDLTEYKGNDLHSDHPLIKEVCRKLALSRNVRRTGKRQGKQSRMEFISRILSPIGFGTSSRWRSTERKHFYAIADKARARLEGWQFDRGMEMLGLDVESFELHEFSKKLYDKCWLKDKQIIKELSVFCERFPEGFPAILKIAYLEAKNLTQLHLIHCQLALVFDSVDRAFLEISEAIETRYRGYEAMQKSHDFERILLQKNEKVIAENPYPETMRRDHLPPLLIKEKRAEGDRKVDSQNQDVLSLDKTANNGDPEKVLIENMVSLSVIVGASPPKPTSFKQGDRAIYKGFRYVISAIKGGFATLRDLFDGCLPIDCPISDLEPVTN